MHVTNMSGCILISKMHFFWPDLFQNQFLLEKHGNVNYLNPCCLLLAYLKSTRILLTSLSVYAVLKMFVGKHFSYPIHCVYI